MSESAFAGSNACFVFSTDMCWFIEASLSSGFLESDFDSWIRFSNTCYFFAALEFGCHRLSWQSQSKCVIIIIDVSSFEIVFFSKRAGHFCAECNLVISTKVSSDRFHLYFENWSLAFLQLGTPAEPKVGRSIVALLQSVSGSLGVKSGLAFITCTCLFIPFFNFWNRS